MRPFPRLLLAAAALGATLPAFGQALIFKGGERWEVNDPFKVDTTVIPPKPIIDKLRADCKKAADSEKYTMALRNLGQDPAFLDAPDFKAFIDEDAKRIEEAVRLIGKV